MNSIYPPFLNIEEPIGDGKIMEAVVENLLYVGIIQIMYSCSDESITS